MKQALVTGSSQGLGAALVQELLSQGYQVVGIARSRQEAMPNFIPLVCDVGDSDAVMRISADLRNQNIVPELFFLNAAVTGKDSIEETLDLEKEKTIMNVNYFGVLAWVAAWHAHCKDGASFVVSCSVNAHFAPPTVIAYSASKAAIAKAFEALRFTYPKLNFSVAYLGPINTGGLHSPIKLPFTQNPTKLARTMIRNAQKTSCEPSLFYAIITRLLRWFS